MKKTYKKEAIEFIARMANGGMRDAISLLEKCIDYSSEINIDTVIQALGLIDYDVLYDIVIALKDKNVADLITKLEEVYISGIDMKFLIKQLLAFILDVCTYSNLKNFKYVNIPEEFEDKLNFLTDNCTSAPKQLLKDIIDLDNKLRYETNPKLLVESTMVVLCN